MKETFKLSHKFIKKENMHSEWHEASFTAVRTENLIICEF